MLKRFQKRKIGIIPNYKLLKDERFPQTSEEWSSVKMDQFG